MHSNKSIYSMPLCLLVFILFLPNSVLAQGTRDRLFNEFEVGIRNLSNPLIAADAMQSIRKSHPQIVRGSITDVAALWPSLLAVDETTNGARMHQFFDTCADIAFGRNNTDYPNACLSPEIFAVYSQRQAAQFIQFNPDIRRHPALQKSRQLSIDHGSLGALILAGRHSSDTQNAIKYFVFARELAVAKSNRLARISAEAHIVKSVVHEQGTANDVLLAMRINPDEKVIPRRQASPGLVTVFIVCINEVFAAATEDREAKAACADFFEGASITPADLEDPAKIVSMNSLVWDQHEAGWVTHIKVETSRAAFTLLKFTDLSCPLSFWVSQYHISEKLDGVTGSELKNFGAPAVGENLGVEIGDSSFIFFHNDSLVTRGLRRSQTLAVSRGDEDFAYALLDQHQRVMHGPAGETVKLTLSILAPSDTCTGKFGWLFNPSDRQQNESIRLE